MTTPPSRSIVQIYAAAVCFVAVGCLAIAVGIAAYAAIGVFRPALTANPMSLIPLPPAPPTWLPAPVTGAQPSTAPTVVVPAIPSQEEEAKRRAEALENGLRNEVALSRQSLLRWGIVALVSALLFGAHWRLLRRPEQHSA